MSFLDRLFGKPPAASPPKGQSVSADANGQRNGSSNDVSIDPTALMRLKTLELRAKTVVEGFMSGIHRSPYHGFSVEFTDYRPYSPGDDVRYIDWKLFARQDRYYIKRFEDETNLRCYLVADLSGSMEFGTLEYSKADYARTLMATFAYFLSLQRDAVGLLTFDQTIGEYIPPRFRSGHMRRLMLALERATSGKRTEIAPPLEQITKLAKRRSLIVLVSDLLAPIDQLDKKLAYLNSQGHEVVIWRVLDPSEIQFNFEDATIFEDLESGKRLFVDPEAVKKNYLKRFKEHADQLEEICRQKNCYLSTISMDEPLENVLSEFVRWRSLNQKSARRHSNQTRTIAGGAS